MDPCSKPNLLLVAILISYLFSAADANAPTVLISGKNVSAANANANATVLILGKNVSAANANANNNANAPLSQLVTDFCNDQHVDGKAFCLRVLGSDPRSATTDKVALAKLGMEQTQNNMKKIVQEFSSRLRNPATPPSLKPVLQSCVESYKGLMSSFEYYFKLAASGQDEGDYMMTWDYDITLAGERVTDCQKALSSTAPHDDSLVKKSQIGTNYYDIGFKATGILASLLPRPQ